MSNDFFKNELLESVMVPYKGILKNYNARDIADLTFLYFLALQIMKSEFHTAPLAMDYAKQTFKWNNFNKYNRSGTDLYILIHILFGKDKKTFNLLKSDRANKAFKQKIKFNQNRAKTWARAIAANKTTNKSSDMRFLMELEKGLLIMNSDYKAIRRRAAEWQDIPEVAKQAAMTRLIFAIRAKTVRSELLPSLKKLAKLQNFMLTGVEDSEKAAGAVKKFSLLAKAASAAAQLSLTTKNAFRRKIKEVEHKADKSVDETEVDETAMAGSVGAGAIAATPTTLGGTKNKKTIKKRTSQEIVDVPKNIK